MPPDPVPSPRSGGDDDEGTLLPQPRAASDPPDPTPPAPVDEDVQDAGDEATPEADAPRDEDGEGPAPVEEPAPGPLATPRPPLDDEPSPPPSIVGDPRPAPDDEPSLRAVVGPNPPSTPPLPARRVYADGSALAQYVVGSSSHDDWLAWAHDHEDELVTTPLGLTELRRFALPGGVEARGVAREVEERVTVVRFSDQTLRAATKVSGVLPPFTALHIGAALAHPEIVAVATYETQLARVAALHGYLVVSPGLAPFWWETGD